MSIDFGGSLNTSFPGIGTQTEGGVFREQITGRVLHVDAACGGLAVAVALEGEALRVGGEDRGRSPEATQPVFTAFAPRGEDPRAPAS